MNNTKYNSERSLLPGIPRCFPWPNRSGFWTVQQFGFPATSQFQCYRTVPTDQLPSRSSSPLLLLTSAELSPVCLPPVPASIPSSSLWKDVVPTLEKQSNSVSQNIRKWFQPPLLQNVSWQRTPAWCVFPKILQSRWGSAELCPPTPH